MLLWQWDKDTNTSYWRAKLITEDSDPRVEIRKHFTGVVRGKAHSWEYQSAYGRSRIDAHGMINRFPFAQGVIVVRPDTVTMSFNGKATMNSGDFDALEIVVDEAREALRTWATEQEKALSDHKEELALLDRLPR